MAVGIRGTTPASAGANTPPSVSLTSASGRQPATDDVLLIIAGNDWDTLADIGTPTVGGSTSGVNAVTNGSADGGQFFAHCKAWTKVITAGGSDLTVAWGTDGGVTDEEKCIDVYVLTGADTTAPIDIAGGNFNSTGSTSHVAPSVNATVAGLLICHVNDGNGASSGASTPPSGMTEQYDSVVSGSMAHSGATVQLGATGATGTKTFAKAGNATYAALSIVIKPASGGTNATPTPSTVTGAATVPSPTISAQSNATPTPSAVTGAAVVPSPTVTATSNATINAGAVAGAVIVLSPTIAAQSNATATPSVVSGAATVPAPSVSAGGSTTIGASVVAGAAVVYTPTVSGVINQTIAAAVISRTVVIPTATVVVTTPGAGMLGTIGDLSNDTPGAIEAPTTYAMAGGIM